MPVLHPFEPYIEHNSDLLILGSFPSEKSRESGFYYGHPNNRFWKVIAGIYGYDTPVGTDEKKSLLSLCHIALWDVLHSCEITGSSDATIKNPIPNDVDTLLSKYKISRIYANGSTSFNLYMRRIYPKTQKPIIKLPSTSPANAAYSLARLQKDWSSLLAAE